MKNDIVIINSFPNNEYKLMLLVEQLAYLKKLSKPILLISGCPVPEFIENKVDYLFINTENEVIGKDFSYMLSENKIYDGVYDYIETESVYIAFYWENVNSTIAKNIKLGFNLAKALGYKTVFYTEDDNIWKDGSFNYINNSLNKIKNENFKLASVLGTQENTTQKIIFTTFFFADVDYFCENFTIPVNASDWYNIGLVKKYHLHKVFEHVFYKLFEKDLNVFYNNSDEFHHSLIENDPNNRKNFAWGVYDRRNSEKNLMKTFFTILPANNNEKTLVISNQTHYLQSGPKTYPIRINFDGAYITTVFAEPSMFYTLAVPDEIKFVNLEIENYGTLNLDNSIENIKHNGFLTHKNLKKNEDNNFINYLVGGRLGDFFQTLYVIKQKYKQTGKKGNVYITDKWEEYGGDVFREPLTKTYNELLPLIYEQEYINNFEIFNYQIDDFINLNDWRSKDNLIVDNFPWIKLFNKVYLSDFNDLTYEPWIKTSKNNHGFNDLVVIHRAPYRTTDKINWEFLLKNNNCIFVGFDWAQYLKFPYKHLVGFHKIETISELCSILNTCKFYVGNQTGPTSIAHSMDIPRLIELCDEDAMHYVGEEIYLPKLNWISNVHTAINLKTIDSYINYKML
jgi:hypothetical protein